MNVKRYDPQTIHSSYDSSFSWADMEEDKHGGYVKVEDYLHLMGVVRNLRTKLAKKDRRNRKLKQEGV